MFRVFGTCLISNRVFCLWEMCTIRAALHFNSLKPAPSHSTSGEKYATATSALASADVTTMPFPEHAPIREPPRC
ncbi:hypothetical protein BGZ57DRAFT_884852 [Hyaloscypha finlandica]|nr:hypothetical protein BGZ57DRAFT_884852 [Hyaloscypha finlandica]